MYVLPWTSILNFCHKLVHIRYEVIRIYPKTIIRALNNYTIIRAPNNYTIIHVHQTTMMQRHFCVVLLFSSCTYDLLYLLEAASTLMKMESVTSRDNFARHPISTISRDSANRTTTCAQIIIIRPPKLRDCYATLPNRVCARSARAVS